MSGQDFLRSIWGKGNFAGSIILLFLEVLSQTATGPCSERLKKKKVLYCAEKECKLINCLQNSVVVISYILGVFHS